MTYIQFFPDHASPSNGSQDFSGLSGWSPMPRRMLRTPGGQRWAKLNQASITYHKYFYWLESHLAPKKTSPLFAPWLPQTIGGVSLVGTAMGSFELGELAAAWDESDSIRERLRAGQNLLDSKPGHVDSSIAECKANQDVLVPMLHRFFAARLKLPEIGGLRHEIELLYKKNMQTPDESRVDDNGWDLRKMLRFIKRKASRDDPSTDPCKHSAFTMVHHNRDHIIQSNSVYSYLTWSMED